MAITYKFNAGSAIDGVVSTWQRQPLRHNDDGTIDYSSYAINRWQLPVMDMTIFETLRAQQGNSVTSLDTNDIDARNTGKQYTDAFIGLVSGEQRGLQVEGVNIEFRVKV